MLVDATDRPIFDDEDGERDLFVNPDSASQDHKKARETRSQHEKEQAKQNNMIDLDEILGGGIPSSQT